jgi:hypothetical protein
LVGPAQQLWQLACPVFLFDFDQGLQFAQMVGVTQGVQHALQGVGGLVMNDDAGDTCQ